METTDGSTAGQGKSLPTDLKLKKLSLEQVKRIDEILASLGDYGEVHLIVQHGQLRYINRVQRYKAWIIEDGSDDSSG
jgi:hypothetical protein